MASSIVIKGGTFISANTSRKTDILIRDGRIATFGENLEAEETINASGCIVVPSFADIHVHLREPGFEYKETIKTGTLAAARGGYTLVCPMPNLNPVPDCPENLQIELDAIAKDACIDVRPYCAITKGRQGKELVDFSALKGRCIAFSDDGSGVQDEDTMRQAMQMAAKEECIIAAHCEDNSLLNEGYIHDGAYCQRHGYKGICSESEWGQIKRDIELCRESGCHYHVCHISTAESVELIRKAKADGVNITCETAPHYLLLTDDDLQEEGRFKMNPPLRSARDRDALLEGLRDGTIDVIATDHAPHSKEEKTRGLKCSAMGIVGLETSFPVLYTGLVQSGKLSIERLVEAMSEAPRRIFKMENDGSADLTIINISKTFRIDSSTFLSKGHSTPFDSMKVRGKVKQTLWKGKTVYKG